MKPKMWPRQGQESSLGEISSLEISRSPRCGQDGVKKAFLVKSLAQRSQDEAQDGQDRVKKAFLVKSLA